MKKVMLLAASVSYLLVGTAIPVSAQVGQPTMLKGDVPFAFVSGDRTIPAGQYSIQIRQSQVRFLDANGHPVQAIFSNPRQENGSQEKPRLVFHQYGEAYFLWQIWTRITRPISGHRARNTT